jgi:hypothetical protein
MVRFVTVDKMAEQTGYTRNAIYKKCNDGIWPQGTVWHRAPDGRILIDTEEYEKWVVTGGALNRPQSRPSKSRSSTAASDAESVSRCRLQPLI